MKLIAIFAIIFSSSVFAQDTGIISGEYKLKYNQQIREVAYNQKSAISAAIRARAACSCRVDIIQPTLTLPYVASSSSASSSVRSSVSSSSSSVALQTAELSWTAPTERVDGVALNPDSELSGFNLKLNGSVVFVPYIAPAMSYTIYDYSPDKTYAIAAVDKSDTSSAYVDFVR